MQSILDLADAYANRSTRVGSSLSYSEDLAMREGEARNALAAAVAKLEADSHVLALAVLGLIAENYPHTLSPDDEGFLKSLALAEGEMETIMPDDYDPFRHAQQVMLAARKGLFFDGAAIPGDPTGQKKGL